MRQSRTPKELGFDRYDARRLRHALDQTESVRSYRRLQAVLLLAQGYSVRQVAQMTNCKPWAIYSWLDRYLVDHNPQDLNDRDRSGRPPVAAQLTDQRIIEEFHRDPMALGYNSTQWTVALLATHLQKQYGCSFSEDTLRRRMRHLGLRWKRPRHVFSTKDPNRAQKKGGWFGG